MSVTNRTQIGKQGEELAVRYLLSSGYDVQGVNLRIKRDEIDIVAYDPVDNAMVFVEVKTRSRTHADFRPELGLDRRKKHAMKRAARGWVAEHDYRGGYRMDLVCVVGNQVVDHLKQLSWE